MRKRAKNKLVGIMNKDNKRIQKEEEEYDTKYRLMIYFCVATFHFYHKDIIIKKGMTITEFRVRNKDIVQRVFDEGKTIFAYTLSNEQMNRAISAYGTGVFIPQSVKETVAWTTLKVV